MNLHLQRSNSKIWGKYGYEVGNTNWQREILATIYIEALRLKNVTKDHKPKARKKRSITSDDGSGYRMERMTSSLKEKENEV